MSPHVSRSSVTVFALLLALRARGWARGASRR